MSVGIQSFRVLLLLCCLFLGSCAGGQSGQRRGAQVDRGQPLNYVFPGVAGGAIQSSQHRGRITVLLFITTFDVFSQSQASRLEDLYRSHEPRLNAVAVVLEAPRNALLVQSFVDVMKLTYPVAVTEKRVLEQQGVLSAVQSVPAWVFLDRQGRVAAGASGTLSIDELERAVKLAED